MFPLNLCILLFKIAAKLLVQKHIIFIQQPKKENP